MSLYVSFVETGHHRARDCTLPIAGRLQEASHNFKFMPSSRGINLRCICKNNLCRQMFSSAICLICLHVLLPAVCMYFSAEAAPVCSSQAVRCVNGPSAAFSHTFSISICSSCSSQSFISTCNVFISACVYRFHHDMHAPSSRTAQGLNIPELVHTSYFPSPDRSLTVSISHSPPENRPPPLLTSSSS